MSAILTPNADCFDDEVFAPSEWDHLRDELTPSGIRPSTVRAAQDFAAPGPITPTGGWFQQQLLSGGIVLTLAAAAAAWGAAGISGVSTRAPGNMAPAVTAAPAAAIRRRDESDAPADDAPQGHPAGSVTRGGASTAEATVAAEVTSEATAITAAERLATIQDTLSLSVTHLAEVLRVSRGTVYSWLRGEVDVPRDLDAMQRLTDLYRVARQFRARSAETVGRLIAAPLGDEQSSLLALLSADVWDRAAIDDAVTILAGRLETRRQERDARRNRGIGRAHPVDEETLELERLRLRLGEIG